MAHLAALLEQIETPGSPFVTLYTYIVAAGCWASPPCSLFPASSVFLSLGLAELLEERDTCDHLFVCRLLLLHNCVLPCLGDTQLITLPECGRISLPVSSRSYHS